MALLFLFLFLIIRHRWGRRLRATATSLHEPTNFIGLHLPEISYDAGELLRNIAPVKLVLVLLNASHKILAIVLCAHRVEPQLGLYMHQLKARVGSSASRTHTSVRRINEPNSLIVPNEFITAKEGLLEFVTPNPPTTKRSLTIFPRKCICTHFPGRIRIKQLPIKSHTAYHAESAYGAVTDSSLRYSLRVFAHTPTIHPDLQRALWCAQNETILVFPLTLNVLNDVLAFPCVELGIRYAEIIIFLYLKSLIWLRVIVQGHAYIIMAKDNANAVKGILQRIFMADWQEVCTQKISQLVGILEANSGTMGDTPIKHTTLFALTEELGLLLFRHRGHHDHTGIFTGNMNGIPRSGHFQEGALALPCININYTLSAKNGERRLCPNTRNTATSLA